jgi:hypothetical protein
LASLPLSKGSKFFGLQSVSLKFKIELVKPLSCFNTCLRQKEKLKFSGFLVIFTSLVALYIVDKTIAWKVNLISPEQNEQLFDLIRTLVLMIFSYYFGTKDSKKEQEE